MNKRFPANLSTILIVDDNPKNLQVLGNYLQDEGFNLEFALDGKSALGWMERKHFDLVLLDIMMPGMDGYEVCTRIQNNERISNTPVIFLTANADTESVVKGFSVGAVDYVTKPFNKSELIARVYTQVSIQKSNEKLARTLLDVEEKNQLIIHSIKYAKSIQSALLKPSLKYLESFPEEFILFMPKDIVSGDFYWTSRVGNKHLFGVFDCTGHGVPGAFMSVFFVSYLNEIVNRMKIVEPNLIMDQLRDKVIEGLEQKGNIMEVNDGMDGSLISYDPEKSEVHFAGAFSTMYIIRDNKIMEFRGDRMPVAYYKLTEKFSFQKIGIKKGDVLYLFTDGYADQFGGPRQKKMKPSIFRKILLEISTMPMDKQSQLLLDAHTEWKGDECQVDDITIMGIRF